MSDKVETRRIIIREYSDGNKFLYVAKIHELDGVGAVEGFKASSIDDLIKQLGEELE